MDPTSQEQNDGPPSHGPSPRQLGSPVESSNAFRPHVRIMSTPDVEISDNSSETMEPPLGGRGIRRFDSNDIPISPILRRRSTRVPTFKSIDYEDFDGHRPGWQPGSEPGFDPSKSDGGHASMPTLSAPCEITVVDFSQIDMVMHHFDNNGFIDFLHKPQEEWAKCRWININGLSWDVIQAVGQNKKLHKLSLEDIMNTRNRTKADW
jgi:hypothetical protein